MDALGKKTYYLEPILGFLHHYGRSGFLAACSTKGMILNW